ncbi:MAG: carboxypeptidase-like regulatory domain-containing protein [Candidatus Limnocylindrales bacterium]
MNVATSITTAVLALCLLVGCASGGTPTGTTPAAPIDLRGTVTAGPTCPVQREPPDPACADKPVAGAIIVVTDASGATAGRITSTADGSYALGLAPGVYTLTPQPFEGLLGTAPPQTVQLESGAVFSADFSYDTGIR